MATAGLYDDSGKWLYHTGLPKSGVGGGIIQCLRQVRHRRDLAAADDTGNSIRAALIAAISNALGATRTRHARSSSRIVLTRQPGGSISSGRFFECLLASYLEATIQH